MARNCQSCGEEFSPRESYHQYCDACYRAYRRGTTSQATSTGARSTYSRSYQTADDVESQECLSCGESFVPRASFHRYCDACYREQYVVSDGYSSSPTPVRQTEYSGGYIKQGGNFSPFPRTSYLSNSCGFAIGVIMVKGGLFIGGIVLLMALSQCQ